MKSTVISIHFFTFKPHHLSAYSESKKSFIFLAMINMEIKKDCPPTKNQFSQFRACKEIILQN